MPTATNTAQHRIVLIDPEEEFLLWAGKHLQAPDLRIDTFQRTEEALASCKKDPPSLVIAEYALQPFNGVELLKKLRLQTPKTLVILTTGIPPNSAVIETMRLGGYDFLRKSALPYELRPTVESALQTIEEMAAEPAAKRQKAVDPQEALGNVIIGESPAIQNVLKMIGRVSRSDAPVLITGESGCGKEVVAKAVHQFSTRAAKPFVAINCAAIPETLLESELFGHEKGAFTGAMQQRIGRFEQGNGGTLFLDEIGEMPILVQSKLLRVLQEAEFSRVGGNQTLKANVRVVAATNRDPEGAIAAGTFREDLYYRLNVVRIHIPPLRERTDDIKPLAEHFLHRISATRKGPTLRFSLGAMHMLQNYNWPGNVRELENVVQRAAVLATGNIIMPRDLPIKDGDATPAAAPAASLDTPLRQLIEEQLSSNPDTPLIETLRKLITPAVADLTPDAESAAKHLGE
ncbi:sigma-54-dependent transcriptional regulator [Sulfuriroseicoccus oceanibius]|uniref:Sigma-54-dependent Fis family transcriptional regulator n=1 Tax=Sulfuriroseicoccus oceanibius TaxID=2707525 RepID=A0A6B3L827_9BACT|nr:sigma-54 dependent transcriptional regulator [Sulfuriroseicoccus oceanibius]QQL43893.1 sigma-54-dependent Fis family transcriptional regulator [Sulfuriroseicoccus oceanibius]